MIRRRAHVEQVQWLLGFNPVVALLGPRQVGKTTLARQVARAWPTSVTWFDLERPRDLARLADASLALERLEGLVVLDEIHRRPDLFPLLRVLADRKPLRARLLILGSASESLLRNASESLAGRLARHELGGLSLEEVGRRRADDLWLRGAFPRALLARNDAESLRWREELVTTFLERDVPQVGIQIPATTLRRFWTMLAHYHAQRWNGAELARAFGVGEMTVRRYLELLTQLFMVRQLQPWHENLAKRQVKAPKIFVKDTGLLHALLGIRDETELHGHPKVGASWEGFVLQAILDLGGFEEHECFHWATHQGAELDLLVLRGKQRWGFEIKRTDSPQLTPSMRIAREDLKLDRLVVVHGGADSFPLAPGIEAVPLSGIARVVAGRQA